MNTAFLIYTNKTKNVGIFRIGQTRAGRQAGRLAGWQAGRLAGRQAGRLAGRQGGWLADRQTDRGRDGRTGRQVGRQKYRQAEN